jgi:FMN-dependent NADH-azoreductase
MADTILRIDCSPKAAAAHSSRMADEVMRDLMQRHDNPVVIHRVLSNDPAALVDSDFAASMMTHQSAELARDHPPLKNSEILINELESADLLILSTPMHNFTVPAALKAWIDQIVRFGRTFKSTPDGKIGLLADRPTYIVIAAGGFFVGDRARQPDHLTPYLKDILATIGITDLRFIVLEGLARGEEAVNEAYQSARNSLKAL